MRARRVFWNTITALSYQVILIISGLIVPRLILENYGSELNGIVSSANQFMGVVGILTIGLTGAVRIELYKSLACNDLKLTNKVMNTTISYMHQVSIVIIVYTLILAIVYPNISHTNVPVKTIFALLCIVGLGKFFENFLGIPYRILLQADQKNYIENILTSISCIIYTVLSIWMIQKKYSLLSVKLMSAFVSLVVMLEIYVYAKNTYHLKRSKVVEKKILSHKRDAAIHSIANIVHQNSDLVILTLFEDAKLISVYTVYYFVIGQIKKLLEAFISGLEAAFGNIWAKKEYQVFNDRFRLFEFFIYEFVVVIFSCILILILPFISLYTKNVTDINYVRADLAMLIVLAEVVYCIRQPYTIAVQAAGKYKETKNIAITEAVVNVTISLILVYKIGINGIIIGTICANIIRTIYYMYYVSKEILMRDYSKIMYRVLWMIVSVIGCTLIGERIVSILGEINTWMHWMVAGFLSFLCSVILSLLSSILFYRNDIREFIKIIRKMIVRCH